MDFPIVIIGKQLAKYLSANESASRAQIRQHIHELFKSILRSHSAEFIDLIIDAYFRFGKWPDNDTFLMMVMMYHGGYADGMVKSLNTSLRVIKMVGENRDREIQANRASE